MAPILTLFRSDDRPGDSGWFYAGPVVASEDRKPMRVSRIGEGMGRMFRHDRWNVAMAYYPVPAAVVQMTTHYLDDQGWHEVTS